ncbi:MAG: PH domain-containing protein [Phycisphaeraceae bacterium]
MTEQPPPTSQETIVWVGGPSQWIGSGRYTLIAVVILAVAIGWLLMHETLPVIVPVLLLAAALAYGLWVWASIASIRYTLSTQRITTHQGVFTRRSDEMELYRVKDTVVLEPLWLRLLGRGHVQLKTSDATTPVLLLRAIRNPTQVRSQIRDHVERIRQLRGVREVDIEPGRQMI